MSVQQAAFVVAVVAFIVWVIVCLRSALRVKPPMARRRKTAVKPIRIARAPDQVCERRYRQEFEGWKQS